MIRRWIIIISPFIAFCMILGCPGVKADGEAANPAARNFQALLASAASLERGNSSANVIALTFDGGWKCEATAPILDTLAKHKVRATFFITGEYIKRYPDLVRRIVAEGHEVGNHTYSHPHLTNWNRNRNMHSKSGVTREFLQDELNRTHILFNRVTGKRFAPYWRAPYGEQNVQIRRWAAELGYLHVGWTRGGGSRSLDTLDWVGNPGSRLYRSADSIARRVVNFDRGVPGGASGAIILMHLGSSRSHDYPHEKLGWIIEAMRRKGYEFVAIGGMLRYLT